MRRSCRSSQRANKAIGQDEGLAALSCNNRAHVESRHPRSLQKSADEAQVLISSCLGINGCVLFFILSKDSVVPKHTPYYLTASEASITLVRPVLVVGRDNYRPR